VAPCGPSTADWSGLDALGSAALLSAVPADPLSATVEAPSAAATSTELPTGDHHGHPACRDETLTVDDPAGDGGGASEAPDDCGGTTAAPSHCGSPADDTAAAAPAVVDPTRSPVQLCFGMDQGGRTSTVKAFLGIANQRHPASVGHSIVLGVFPCKTDDHTALKAICGVWLADIEELRANGVQVRGETCAVRVILTGDYRWMTAFAGHSGPSAGMPCMWCTAVSRPTTKNAAMVEHFGYIQDASRCRGWPRDATHALRMCARYATGPNASLARHRALRRHLSIERRPLMVIDAKDVAPIVA